MPGILLDPYVGRAQKCPGCRSTFTLLGGPGWSRCPFDGRRLIELMVAVTIDSPALPRSLSSRRLAKHCGGRRSTSNAPRFVASPQPWGVRG